MKTHNKVTGSKMSAEKLCKCLYAGWDLWVTVNPIHMQTKRTHHQSPTVSLNSIKLHQFLVIDIISQNAADFFFHKDTLIVLEEFK